MRPSRRLRLGEIKFTTSTSSDFAVTVSTLVTELVLEDDRQRKEHAPSASYHTITGITVSNLHHEGGCFLVSMDVST
jgi:hypothetical protein